MRVTCSEPPSVPGEQGFLEPLGNFSVVSNHYTAEAPYAP